MAEDTNPDREDDMTSLAKLADEWRPRAGEIVLVYDETFARIVGIGADDSDLYYICDVKTGWDTHTRSWMSAVGHIEPLKGYLQDEAYARLERSLTTAQSHPEPFFTACEMGLPRRHFRREPPNLDHPYCPACNTNWVRRVARNPHNTRMRKSDLEFIPACACHHNCRECNTPRRTYPRGALHPEREGFLCPQCDAAPTSAKNPPAG